MSEMLENILGQNGSIARRLGQRYEYRPQQMEMAHAVESALNHPSHLLVEAGTGVGKSFAYLLPAIDFALKNKKRVVISTNTISLQEQLIDKDIPLLRAVYPDEFVAVLVKGRSNYLCLRRLEKAGQLMYSLFEHDRQIRSLQVIEQWAKTTTDGSLATVPHVPESDVWDKVCAEHGNCLGKRCKFYKPCHWQAARRRMQTGRILIVNHALFFSDLALRAAGVNYLPKYDAVILDEAHTVEDVAGDHFGLKISESGLRYQLRTLYDAKRGKGLLTTHGSAANDAIDDVVELHDRVGLFFARCTDWQTRQGRANGRIHEPEWVDNDLSPKLHNLALHVKAMLANLDAEEDVSELSSVAEKVALSADTLDAIIKQSLEDAVYWMDTTNRPTPRLTLHAAPISVADGLRKHLFSKLPSVIMTSATLCTKSAPPPNPQCATGAPPISPNPAPQRTNQGGTGAPPVSQNPAPECIPNRGTGAPPVSTDQSPKLRQGAYLPHLEQKGGIYAITFRLADSLPQALHKEWLHERDELIAKARNSIHPTTTEELLVLRDLHSNKIESYLDEGHGSSSLRDDTIAQLVADTLQKFNNTQYRLLAWCIMPNHVHLVLQPINATDLQRIMHSVKSWTAKEVNKRLKRSGIFWQPEYYDHLIRNEEDLINQVEYVWSNPDRANLTNWPWRFKDEKSISEIITGSNDSPQQQGRGAPATSDVSTHDNRGTSAPPVSRNQGPNRGTGAPPVSPSQNSPSPAFAYIQSRLGVDKAQTLLLGSPFNYPEQAKLYVESNLPDPNDPTFLPAACEKILHYLRQTTGGASSSSPATPCSNPPPSASRPIFRPSTSPSSSRAKASPRACCSNASAPPPIPSSSAPAVSGRASTSRATNYATSSSSNFPSPSPTSPSSKPVSTPSNARAATPSWNTPSPKPSSNSSKASAVSSAAAPTAASSSSSTAA